MVRVESIKRIRNAGRLRGTAVITVSNRIRIADIRIIDDGHEGAWIALPSRPFEIDGERRWINLVEILDDVIRREVFDAVLTEFQRLTEADASRQTSAPEAW